MKLLKRFLFLFIMVMSSSMVFAQEKVVFKPTQSNENAGHLPGKAPARYTSLPEVYYSQDAASLEFCATEATTAFSFSITRDGSEAELISDSVFLEQGDAHTQPVATLPTGTYILRLYVGGRCYAGTFDIED